MVKAHPDAERAVCHYVVDWVVAFRRAETQQLRADNEIRGLTAARQAILDGANYAIVATDLSGHVTSFNHAAERMLGYAADELVGKQTPEFTA